MEPPLCVVSSCVIRVYTILVWNTISGSSNLDNCFYHCLILISISHLKALFNLLLLLLLIYIVNHLVVRSGYLLLRHSCTWEKTYFWSCHKSDLLGGGFSISIMLVPRYKLSLCHTPIKPDLLGFPGIGVFTWSRNYEVCINGVQ